MLRRGRLLAAFSLLALLPSGSTQAAMVVEVSSGKELVRPSDPWRFYRAGTAPSSPGTAWREIDFADGSWESGPGGFGYQYTTGIGTPLADMRGGYWSVFIRRELTVAGPLDDSPVELEIDYDDGFAAYLNGALVAWRNLSKDPTAPDFAFDTPATSHNAGTPLLLTLGSASEVLREGKNVLAIEGHNNSKDSSDFAMIPTLRLASAAYHDGSRWVVETASQRLRSTAPAAAASVKIGGIPASFNAAEGVWEAALDLPAGLNHVIAEAFDGASAPIDSGAVDVVHIPPAQRLSGALAGDTTLAVAGAGYLVEANVTVPAGATLRIEPGVTVYLKSGVAIEVSGALQADGTEASPIRFTRYGEGVRWKQIKLTKAADSRLAHCLFEYADSAGAHQDYYEPGPRSYHEAIVALASRLDLEGCVFQKLPDEGAAAEGDALAIISDDPANPGPASATIRNCRFIEIGQGVHTRYSYVLVEGCFFTGKRGDNDDVDLWGESDPPPLIKNNRFINPEHDDMINPTRCSAIIIGNFLTGGDDHGIVLRDKASPIVINNVIEKCANGGIAIENSNTALLINNTIADCGRGLRLFDLGRWGPPYNLNPGGGTATVINCIVWDCAQPVTLEDSSNTTIADRGSHITVLHSLIQNGQNGVSVSGAQSTVTWGEGNLSADPLFVAAGTADYHLQPDSPAINAGQADQAPATDFDSRARPCGGGFDMGAYELCTGEPLAFRRGDPNGDGSTDISDVLAVLFHLFAAGREPECVKSADTDDDGSVKMNDALALLFYLFQDGAPPSAPFPACAPDPTADVLACGRYAACQ